MAVLLVHQPSEIMKIGTTETILIGRQQPKANLAGRLHRSIDDWPTPSLYSKYETKPLHPPVITLFTTTT